MNKVLLSELAEDVMLSFEDSYYTLSPSELRQRIESGKEVVGNTTWHVATEKRWTPDVKYMLERYIEDEYNNGMYEDWDERAMDCLKQEHYDRIQTVLDEAFQDDYATKYWMLDGPEVIIDYSPILEVESK